MPGLREDLEALLEGVRRGEVEPRSALERLAQLPFRDLGFARADLHRELRQGAPEAVLASDLANALAEQARSRDPRRLREAAERCEDVRQALELNVMEDVALSALGFRLAALAGMTSPVPLIGWAEPGATAPGLVVQAGPVTPPGAVKSNVRSFGAEVPESLLPRACCVPEMRMPAPEPFSSFNGASSVDCARALNR